MAAKAHKVLHWDGGTGAVSMRFIGRECFLNAYLLSWSSCAPWADRACGHVTEQRRSHLCRTTRHESLLRWPLWALCPTAVLPDMLFLCDRRREGETYKWTLPEWNPVFVFNGWEEQQLGVKHITAFVSCPMTHWIVSRYHTAPMLQVQLKPDRYSRIAEVPN